MLFHIKQSAVALLALLATGIVVSLLAWRGLLEKRDERTPAPTAVLDVDTELPGQPAMVSAAAAMNPNASTNGHLDHISQLKNSLLALPPELGGGLALNDSIGEYRDADYPHLATTSGIRAVEGAGFSPAAWNSFKDLRQVEQLYSSYGDVTNEDLICLSSFPLLEVLRLHSPVHRSGPRTWPNRRPPFSAVILKSISNMSHLRELSLASDYLTDEGLENVPAASGLLALTLDGFFTNEGLRQVSKLKELRRLSLTGNFDDEGLLHLKALADLESLELNSPHLHGPGLAYLAELQHLRYVRIGQASPSLSLKEIARWPALEALDLGSNEITDDILATLSAMPQVESFSLEWASISDRGLSVLAQLPGLIELNVRSTLISDTGINTIIETSSFPHRLLILCLGERDVSTRSPGITQSGLAKLSHLRRLEALDLRYVNLERVDLNVLAFPSLRRLNVEGLDAETRGAELSRLRERLPLLSRDNRGRILIRADVFKTGDVTAYDFLTNQLKIEL